MKDWTAPHEISHLAIPFLGKSNSWIAEGFATYMQNEILLELKEMSQAEVDEKYRRKLSNAYPYYQENSTFAETAMALRKRNYYAEMYWGGAYFFMQLDKRLKAEKNMNLCAILKQYQDCCRMGDSNINDVLKSLDKISKSSIAQDLMEEYKSKPSKMIMNKKDFQ